MTAEPSHVVVAPIYEDREASAKLFSELRAALGPDVFIVAVDDGSVRQPVETDSISEAGLKGVVLRLRRNVGHQRCHRRRHRLRRAEHAAGDLHRHGFGRRGQAANRAAAPRGARRPRGRCGRGRAQEPRRNTEVQALLPRLQAAVPGVDRPAHQLRQFHGAEAGGGEASGGNARAGRTHRRQRSGLETARRDSADRSRARVMPARAR